MGLAAQDPGILLRGAGVRRGERWILRDINWSVPAGACAAILGPNGSGKSTLARLLCGYIWPTVGEVAIGGQRLGETDVNQLRHSIRLVQAAGPYDVDAELTTHEAILTGLYGTIGLFDTPTPSEREHGIELLQRVGLAKVIDHPYSTLSSGERVRTLIARALMARPTLLLLDEPTAGLDLLAREQVLATIQRLTESPQPPTVLFITHHVEELIPAVSRVLLLNDGTIACEGAPAEVLQPEALSSVYGCPVTVRRTDGRFTLHVDSAAWRELLG